MRLGARILLTICVVSALLAGCAPAPFSGTATPVVSSNAASATPAADLTLYEFYSPM